MKRLLLGFPVFLVAFFAGYVIVPDFRTMLTDQSPTAAVERVSQLDVNSAQVVPSSKDGDFVPEFRELPNFENLEVKQSKGELIDFLEDGIYRQSEVIAKNGETWLVLFEHDGNYSLRNSKASVKKLKTISWPGDEPDAKLSFNRQTL